MSLFSKITRGIKRGFQRAGRGIKRGAKKVAKGLKRAGFNKNFGRDFAKGFASVGRALQAPAKYIAKKDPLRKSLGAFSPISLAGSIVTAPLTSVGFLEELAASRKLQNKLKRGDADTIIDLATAPLGLMPIPGAGSAIRSVGKAIGKAGTKAIAKSASKGVGKAVLRAGTKNVTKGGIQNTKPAVASIRGVTKVAGRFDESTLRGLKPIAEISKKPYVKQTLTKAQRLAKAKSAMKAGKPIKQLF